MTDPPECFSCRENATLDAQPDWSRIAYDEYWRVVHGWSHEPGWLILLPRRHVTALAELTPAEAAGLGPWITRLSQALHAELDCVKTYVLQLAEHPDYPHAHFHVVARPADLPEGERGARIFTRLAERPEQARYPEPERAALARRLRDRLVTPSEG